MDPETWHRSTSISATAVMRSPLKPNGAKKCENAV